MNYKHTLIRYFEHDDEEDGDQSIWNVTCGSLEGFVRHYRIFYESDDFKIDFELSLNICDLSKYYIELSDFVFKIREILNAKNIYSAKFIQSINKLITIDPWLKDEWLKPVENVDFTVCTIPAMIQ